MGYSITFPQVEFSSLYYLNRLGANLKMLAEWRPLLNGLSLKFLSESTVYETENCTMTNKIGVGFSNCVDWRDPTDFVTSIVSEGD